VLLPPTPNAFKFRIHQIVITLLIALVAGIAFSTVKGLTSPAVSSPVTLLSSANPMPYLERQTLPNGSLYTLVLPHDAPAMLKLGVSATLAGIESPQWHAPDPGKEKAQAPWFIINGGFFDPQNQQTTSHLVQAGRVAGNPTQNPHLMKNPGLTVYLPAILDRSEFRVYHCQATTTTKTQTAKTAFQAKEASKQQTKTQSEPEIRYDITNHQALVPIGCTIWDAAGGGPLLLPTTTAEHEGFVARNASGRVIRDPIGVSAKNARSVIGINARGDVILMMGAQHEPSASDEESVAASARDAASNKVGNGFSLSDMATFLKAHGAIKAMALDGGSSSGLVYRGEAVYGKFNASGAPIKRPVKSVWMIVPQAFPQ
jgi:Phosphodiester glycosidase